MVQVFYWVLNMAIVGSLLGGILLLLRRIKKLPRNFIYALYSLVLIRFLCPVGFTNGFSFLNLLPKGAVLQVNPFTKEVASAEDYLLFSNVMQKTESYQTWEFISDGWTLAYKIGSRIWVAIGASLFLCFCFMYIRAKRDLNKSKLLKANIYQSDDVNSPIVIGILRPRVILPLSITETNDNFPYIIAHEYTHIKKRDNLWRFVAIVVACVYWFNPMIWILLKYFFIDMELACDETTISTYDIEERKKYAAALLEATDKESTIYATAFANGSVKIRIKRVLKYKKATLLATVCLFGLFLLLTIYFLSNQ